MRRTLATTTLIVVVAIAGGCASRGRPAAPSGAAQSRPRSTASLAIVEPAAGATVTGPKARVRVELTGGRVIPETTTRLAPDEGHIHLILNGKAVSMTYGTDQEVTVARGPNLLQAEFVANDHLSFNPRVIAVVTFVVP